MWTSARTTSSTDRVRICDVRCGWTRLSRSRPHPGDLREVYRLRTKNLGFRVPRAFLLENKWRASRYGIHGKMIDFGKEIEVPFPDLVEEMLEFVDDELDELESRREIQFIRWILENGAGADRQLAAYAAADGDLRKVVDFICDEHVMDRAGDVEKLQPLRGNGGSGPERQDGRDGGGAREYGQTLPGSGNEIQTCSGRPEENADQTDAQDRGDRAEPHDCVREVAPGEAPPHGGLRRAAVLELPVRSARPSSATTSRSRGTAKTGESPPAAMTET